MQLLIISHTSHYRKGGSIVGWGSTVLEIDHLASLFDKVVHLAPLHPGPAPNSSLPYTAQNVGIQSVEPAGGDAFTDKAGIIGQVPNWLAAMKSAMQKADVLHIRCPAAISLLALLSARLWAKGKPTWVKYAGNWHPQTGEPYSYTFQRWWLRRNIHRGVVTVNGKWPDQPSHIISFNNPSYSLKECRHANQAVEEKILHEPIEVIFVGRIETAKGVGRIIEIAQGLHQNGVPFRIKLIGDGPEKAHFEDLIQQQELEDFIKFTGWKKKQDVNGYYRKAHFILHPSTASEGWPKVLSEAMAYGVVPIASTVSSIPQILGESGAGIAIPADDVEAYVDAVLQYTQDAHLWKQASMNGVRASRHFTYEHYLIAVKEAFKQNLKIDLNHG